MPLDRLACQAPFCPPPDRIAHSHWMSHIPFAFWVVDILRPRLLVELGAYQGASFCAFCQQIEHLGLACEAYAIDTWHGDGNMGQYDDTVHADLEAHVQSRYPGFASLVRSTFDEALGQFEDGSIDLLHIDGFHDQAAMLHDFETWLPKMSERGVILMHDIKARLPGYGGVAAWKEISGRCSCFEFTHGYGLGVVLAGSQIPEPLNFLPELAPEAANAFRRRFQAQGKIYERLFDLEQKRLQEGREAASAMKEAREESQAAARNAAKAATEAGNVIAALERSLAEERNKSDREREQLREAILQAELKAQAYENSLSWKLTAPLRKLARYFRS